MVHAEIWVQAAPDDAGAVLSLHRLIRRNFLLLAWTRELVPKFLEHRNVMVHPSGSCCRLDGAVLAVRVGIIFLTASVRSVPGVLIVPLEEGLDHERYSRSV
jgi:hypothetical protein